MKHVLTRTLKMVQSFSICIQQIISFLSIYSATAVIINKINLKCLKFACTSALHKVLSKLIF